MRSRWPNLSALSRLHASEDGATALEFAMVAPALFLLMMGTVEVGLVLTAQNVMESATYSASRLGRTGYTESGQTQEETVMAELESFSSVLLDPERIDITTQSYTSFDSVGDPEPFVDANGNGTRDDGENYTDVNGNGQYDVDQGSAGLGAASNVVVYTMTYDWELFTPMVSSFLGEEGVMTLSARAVVKNEPF